MKILIILLVAIELLFSAQTIHEPTLSIEASGGVVDLVSKNDILYVATRESCVDLFDLKSKKKIRTIKVAKIKDFLGEMVNAKVYSVDVIEDKILILSQTKQGFRRLHVEEKGELIQLISYSDGLSLAKAKFVDKDTILLATLSSEIISFDISTKQQNWQVKASGAKFSNYVLNEQRNEVVIADESGALKILRIKDGKLLKTLEGQNLDNVFQVDYKNSKIATAGQDRRVVVYDMLSSTAYYKSASFLIYSVGLSPSGSLVGYSSDEQNSVSVFNTSTKSTVGVYIGSKTTISNILFLNENEFLVSSDNEIINLYQIK